MSYGLQVLLSLAVAGGLGLALRPLLDKIGGDDR